jgi:hypothetical protein
VLLSKAPRQRLGRLRRLQVPASPKKPATTQRSGSKTDRILDLLKRPSGVSLKELMKATAGSHIRCAAF